MKSIISPLTFSLIVMSLITTSCKTTEEIEREKMVDRMSMQMQQSQKLNASATVRLQDLEERVNQLTGNVQETVYQSEQARRDQMQSITEQLTVLQEANKTQQEQLDAQAAKLAAQEKLLNRILGTIEELAGSKKKVSKSKKKLSPYDQAMEDYRSRRYKAAKPQLQKLLDDKSIKGNRMARVVHNLGMVEFILKEYNNAVIYFSRLYTNHPKFKYNSNGLLYLGKSFEKLGQKEQAKQTYNELISKYPKSGNAKTAKSSLKNL